MTRKNVNAVGHAGKIAPLAQLPRQRKLRWEISRHGTNTNVLRVIVAPKHAPMKLWILK
jgi:hypothetical protein